jgi:hypothetical protein
MKKWIVAGLMTAMLLGGLPQQADAQMERGGIGGLLVGCCFGIRTTGQWNDGKDLHFRDWGRLIPVVNIVLAVWDGIQGYEGITTSDLSQEYGSQYY